MGREGGREGVKGEGEEKGTIEAVNTNIITMNGISIPNRQLIYAFCPVVSNIKQLGT